MRLLTATVPNNCDIVLHGDTHEGLKTLATNKLKGMLRWVMEEPNRFFVHMGDEIEARTVDHPYYRSESVNEPVPLRQMKRVVKTYWPARERCLCWLNGNHPASLERFGNLTEECCAKLSGMDPDDDGIPPFYGTWTCKLKLVNGKGRQLFKMFLVHGYRNLSLNSNAKDYEQQQANMKASLKRRLAPKASDCLVMACGHTHKLLVVEPSKKLLLADDGSKIIQAYLGQGDGTAPYIEPDRRWYVNTGSFCRLYTMDEENYAERGGYDPIEIGYPVVKIRNGNLVGIEKVVV